MGTDEAFAAKCARAREMQADYMDDLILDVAHACTPETANADRVKISAYQWRASKLAPKRYGDKVTNVVEGGDRPVELAVTDIDAARRVAFLLASAAQKV